MKKIYMCVKCGCEFFTSEKRPAPYYWNDGHVCREFIQQKPVMEREGMHETDSI